MDEEKQIRPGYWAVIPAAVRYDDRIPERAKILYAEISSLTGEAGYCWADNAYFAQLYRVNERTIRRLLDALADVGYIRIEEDHGEKNRITARRIFAGINPLSGTDSSFDKIVKTDAESAPVLTKMSGSCDKNVQTHNIINQEIITHGPTRVGPRAAEWKPERFDAFWRYYRGIRGQEGRPRNENRAAALAAWDKLRPDDALIARIGRALVRQQATDEWIRGIGIPRAATYLNQRRWEDAEELPAPSEVLAPTAEGRTDLEWI